MATVDAAHSSTADTSTADRKTLLDVLQFLERRGAAPDVIALAMQRASIQADVARLLSRCPVAGTTPATEPMQIQRRRNGIAAERALRSGARVLGLWLLLFGSALVSGMAIGYEIGVASGWDAGMDKLIALVSGS